MVMASTTTISPSLFKTSSTRRKSRFGTSLGSSFLFVFGIPYSNLLVVFSVLWHSMAITTSASVGTYFIYRMDRMGKCNLMYYGYYHLHNVGLFTDKVIPLIKLPT